MKLILEELSIWQQCHQHFVQSIIFFQQVFIGKLYFSPLWQLFLSIHQHVLAKQLPQNFVLFFQLSNWKVNWDKWGFKTSEQLFFRICLFGILGNCPQKVFIAKLVNFLKRKRYFELLINLYDPILHLLLLCFLFFQFFFHFFIPIFCFFNLSLQSSSNLFFFFLQIFQLCVKFIKAFFQCFQLLIFASTQFFLQLFYLRPYLFFSRPQHFSPQDEESPTCVLSLDFLEQFDNISASLYKMNDDFRALQVIELFLHLLIIHFDDLSKTTTVICVDLVLLPIAKLLQLLQDQVQPFPLLTHHKGSDQSYCSAALFLKSLLQVHHISGFARQGCPLELLEAIPFGNIILLSKNIFDDVFHSFLDSEPTMRNQFYSFPNKTDLINVKSVKHKGDTSHFVGKTQFGQLRLGRAFGLGLRRKISG